jgi:hypothetical protein
MTPNDGETASPDGRRLEFLPKERNKGAEKSLDTVSTTLK